MKKTLLTLLLGVSAIGTAQIATGNNYTATQLVNDVLMSNAGVTATNITSSSAINYGNIHSLGYFSQNGSSFPLQEGIILSTGNIDNAPGPNTTSQSVGGWGGDADIQAVMNQYGNATYQNATSISFEFVAPSTVLTFDYIFASEEYGTYQCTSNDAIAFILTDLDTDASTNIAYLPNTTIPIAVWTVRDSQFNSGCTGLNIEYFDQYYDPSNTSAPINFNGSVVPVSATADLTPGHNYRLKIVIADGNDSAFDSALFINGGSFSFDEDPYNLEIGNPNDLFACEPLDGDQISEFNLTQNSGLILNGLSPEDYTINYYEGFDTSAQPIQNPGSYSMTGDLQHIAVKVTENANPDNFAVTQFDLHVAPKPNAGEPYGLGAIDDNNDGSAIFDLTLTQDQIFNGQPADLLSVQYYLTIQDQLGETAAIASPTEFVGTNQTIYFALTYDDSWCKSYGSFEIVVLPSDYETPAPSGDAVQTFTEGETLANIELEGDNIQWYATEGNEAGRSDDTPLPLSTPLVHNTTYYASQTVYGIESSERYPVTVNAVLGVTNNTFTSLQVYPNPVNDILTIVNSEDITTITVYNLLGQQVLSKDINNSNAQINVSSLNEGIYLVKISASGTDKILRFSKK